MKVLFGKKVWQVLIISFLLGSSLLQELEAVTLASDDVQRQRHNWQAQVLLKNLQKISQSGRFIFGQQRATLTGVGEYGQDWWNDSQFGRDSDVKRITGHEVGLLGIDAWDLAIKSSLWNRSAYSQAIRRFYRSAQGGVITLDWHMRACDVREELGSYGEYSIPGWGFKIDKWDHDSNRSCLCRIVNEEPWYGGKTWKNWLFEQKLGQLAELLRREGLTDIPMIFRPFHEHNGSWFWWGQKSWNCQQHLGRSDVISGAEAYKKLFRMTVDYLRYDQGFDNFLYAYSTDRLCKHEGHTCDVWRAKMDSAYDDELQKDYLYAYPGDDYVDILGIDLYFTANYGHHWQTPEYQEQVFGRYVKAVSDIAKNKGKVAAITEIGNNNIHQEKDSGSKWFSEHLMQMIQRNGSEIAFAMVWENREAKPGHYFIPHRTHAGVHDFLRFSENQNSLFYPDIKGIYEESFWQNEEPSSDHPYCQSTDSDADGDGWGWENNKSCLVKEGSSVPTCQSADSDQDGDGWGWENGQSCLVRW
ncbi:MAG: glycosyl hydrolase [Oligoflexus sp.]